jgi:hypothetical protein
MLDPLQRFKHISMPQVSLDALQLFQCTGPRLGFFGAEAFRHLIHHRQTHTHVKPVEQVFGLGIQIELQCDDVLAELKQILPDFFPDLIDRR